MTFSKGTEPHFCQHSENERTVHIEVRITTGVDSVPEVEVWVICPPCAAGFAKAVTVGARKLHLDKGLIVGQLKMWSAERREFFRKLKSEEITKDLAGKV